MDSQATVLVAEDSLTQAVHFRWLLEGAGFRAVMATNGREALEMIRTSPPDAIITDLDMPEMNGLELSEAVHEEFPKIPIVLATAVGSEAIAAEALRKGAASYVPKQFLSELISTVKELIAVAQAECTSSPLCECATCSETQYCLTNAEGVVPPLVAELQQLVERSGLRDINGALRVATALDEALQNAIIHGNLEVSSKLREGDDVDAYYTMINQRRHEAPFKDRRAYVRARVTTDFAEISIRDEGPGFDPKSIPDPTDPVNLDRPCGRGLWLIHAFMDEVKYNDQGNEITMIVRKRPK